MSLFQRLRFIGLVTLIYRQAQPRSYADFCEFVVNRYFGNAKTERTLPLPFVMTITGLGIIHKWRPINMRDKKCVWHARLMLCIVIYGRSHQDPISIPCWFCDYVFSMKDKEKWVVLRVECAWKCMKRISLRETIESCDCLLFYCIKVHVFSVPA